MRLSRDMFEDEEPTGEDQIQEWRHKLVLATTHLRRSQELKKTINGELNGQVKHYRKMTEALADAVRFKSPLELERALGPKWEDFVKDIRPRDGYNESLATWIQRDEDSEAKE